MANGPLSCPHFGGVEFDWFAHDSDGCIALFSSGGSAQVPPILEARESQVEVLLAELDLPYGLPPWSRAATLGLFAYDVNLNGGPYRRMSKPAQPLQLQDATPKLRTLAQQITVEGSFRRLRKIPLNRFRW